MQRTAVGDRHPDGAGHPRSCLTAIACSNAATRLGECPVRRLARAALRGARPAVAPAVTTRNPVLVDSGLRPHGVRPRPRHSSAEGAYFRTACESFAASAWCANSGVVLTQFWVCLQYFQKFCVQPVRTYPGQFHVANSGQFMSKSGSVASWAAAAQHLRVPPTRSPRPQRER